MAQSSAGVLHLGLDVGTQGAKAVLVDATQTAVVARAQVSYGLLPESAPGAAEQDPETWIEAVRDVAQKLFAGTGVHATRVAGVGVSGQQHGLCALDQDGRAVRPAKLWCDTSTAEEARELSIELERNIPVGYTASKILWMKRREPKAWARVRRILLPHDFVNLRLCGEATTEAGDASGTGLFDPVAREFDTKACLHIDPRLPELLPPRIVPPGQPAGTLSAQGAALLGLRVGTLLAAGGGDNMMSAIGSGATRPGVVVASLGTSGTCFAQSARPVIDPQGLVAPFCDSTGAWLPLVCVMNMTGVTEEVRRAFGSPDVEALTAGAAEVPAGANGLLLIPYFVGERVPDLPHASGVLFGIRPGLLRPAVLFRAALEGASLSLAVAVEHMRRLGIPVEAVRLVGGGAQNTLWCQIVADALEAPATPLAEPESAALGAALQALWTARKVAGDRVTIDEVAAPFIKTAGEARQPDSARSALYREARARMSDLTSRIFCR